MPWLQQIYERYRSQGLGIVGMTTVNRTASDQSVLQFIDDNDITFPVFKETGVARSALQMPGTPYMILTRDGRFVWEDAFPTETFPEEIIASFVRAR